MSNCGISNYPTYKYQGIITLIILVEYCSNSGEAIINCLIAIVACDSRALEITGIGVDRVGTLQS